MAPNILLEGPIPRKNFTLGGKSFSVPILVAEDVRQVILESNFLVGNTEVYPTLKKKFSFSGRQNHSSG